MNHERPTQKPERRRGLGEENRLRGDGDQLGAQVVNRVEVFLQSSQLRVAVRSPLPTVEGEDERAARDDPDLRRRVIGVLEAFAAQRSDIDATHYALAALFDAAGDTAQAVASYQRYLRLNPWDKRAQKRMELLRGKVR